MKRILLGGPANTVSVSTPNFICNSRCSDWERKPVDGCLGKISRVHLHEAFVWQQEQEARSSRVLSEG